MLSEILAIPSAVTFDQFVVLVQEYQYIIAILTPLVTGEFSIHVFGILNGSGDLSFVPTVLAMVGIVVFDTMIYAGVKVLRQWEGVTERIKKMPVIAQFGKLFQKCEERYKNHPMLLLIAVKVVPMTKITLIFFSLFQKVSLARFVLYDILVTILWCTVIYIPGWLVGKELLTLEAGRQISSIILYILIIIILTLLFGDWVEKILLRMVNKVANALDRNKNTV